MEKLSTQGQTGEIIRNRSKRVSQQERVKILATAKRASYNVRYAITKTETEKKIDSDSLVSKLIFLNLAVCSRELESRSNSQFNRLYEKIHSKFTIKMRKARKIFFYF